MGSLGGRMKWKYLQETLGNKRGAPNRWGRQKPSGTFRYIQKIQTRLGDHIWNDWNMTFQIKHLIQPWYGMILRYKAAVAAAVNSKLEGSNLSYESIMLKSSSFRTCNVTVGDEVGACFMQFGIWMWNNVSTGHPQGIWSHIFPLFLMPLSTLLWSCLPATFMTQVMDIHCLEGVSKLSHFSSHYFLSSQISFLCFFNVLSPRLSQMEGSLSLLATVI